jgi:hypothetical protein
VKQAASRALHDGFLLGLFFEPEDGGDTVHSQSTAWHYIPEEAIFCLIILSHKSRHWNASSKCDLVSEYITVATVTRSLYLQIKTVFELLNTILFHFAKPCTQHSGIQTLPCNVLCILWGFCRSCIPSEDSSFWKPDPI